MASVIHKVTGLMSGSSLDGVDLAYCTFSQDTSGWKYAIEAVETTPYPRDLYDKLVDSCNWDMDPIRALDLELGVYFGNRLNQFHQKYNLHPDLIASHGHTILHDPDRGITFQAGDGPQIASWTGIRVVYDFRSEDVVQGGQGAPMVPPGDRLLFGGYGACLNLGGFANISFEGDSGNRIAFDISPANMALNWLAGQLGLPYDDGGNVARSGKVDPALLVHLDSMDFYKQEPPKSLGREWFLDHFRPLIDTPGLDLKDRLATVTEHICRQISNSLDIAGADTVLVTGGGALNLFLVERLKQLSGKKIEIPEPNLINFKEAMIFGFLGLLRTLGEINSYASVTGGKSDLSAGKICEPDH